MKSIWSFLLIAAALWFASSCTKTNNVTTTVHDSTTVIIRDTIVNRDTVVTTNPKNPIVGLWVGIYKINSAPPADSFYYSFAIRADSTIITSSGGSGGNAIGPWKLNGTAFSATITTMDGTSPESVQAVTATYDSTAGVLSNGVWTFTQGGTGSGTFVLKRVQ